MWKLKIDINTTSNLIFQYRGGGRAKQWGVGGFLAQSAHHGSVFGAPLSDTFFSFNAIHTYTIFGFFSRYDTISIPGLHKLWYLGIRDTSTWSKFGAHGEHGDVFLFSNLGALWFSENLIRYSLHVCLREVKNNLFSFKHSYLRHFSWRFLKF